MLVLLSLVRALTLALVQPTVAIQPTSSCPLPLLKARTFSQCFVKGPLSRLQEHGLVGLLPRPTVELPRTANALNYGVKLIAR